MGQVRGHPHDLTGLNVQADADDELGIAVEPVSAVKAATAVSAVKAVNRVSAVKAVSRISRVSRHGGTVEARHR
jgi:hypothetical protein